jgi:hypothetical protein
MSSGVRRALSEWPNAPFRLRPTKPCSQYRRPASACLKACANTVVENGTLTFASWNQIDEWLKRVEALHREA